MENKTENHISMTYKWVKRFVPSYITNCVWYYKSNFDLYVYASKYWNWRTDWYSFSIAIRRALQDKECPQDIDPFESLVDSNKYKNEEECLKRFDKLYSDAIS